MKKNIYKFFRWTLLLITMACSEDLIVDEVIDNVRSGAALRNLGETNNLDIENGASTYSIILEAQDPSGGNQLSEVIVNVGFNDVDTTDMGLDDVDISQFTSIPSSSFSPSTNSINGLIETTFTVTLDQLVGHVNGSLTKSSANSVSADDVFIIDFEAVLKDGRKFNVDNATGDITRTGFFSYFNSQFRYSAAIGDPQRLVLSSISIDNQNEVGILRSGKSDTVFLNFDRNDAFIDDPTVTRISSVGATDDMVGTLAKYRPDGGGATETYFFVYTAGASVADTIDFAVSGASTVAGLPMKNNTLESAYFIDNVAPTAKLGARSVSTDQSGRILNVRVELLYEPLGRDTVDFQIKATGSTVFDTQTITAVPIAMNSKLLELNFVPQVSGVAIDEGILTFDIVTDPSKTSGAGVIDLVGNEASETINIQIGGS